MKVKLFTHSDLDGIGCVILGKLAFGENLDYEICNYDDVNEKVSEFLMSKKVNTYNKVFITDISVNNEVAKGIDIANKQFTSFTLLDHHPTALFLNEYEWANVIVEDKVIWDNEEFINKIFKMSGTYLFYKYLIENKCEMKPIQVLGDFMNLNNFVEMIRRYDSWEWKTVFNDIEPKKWNDLFHILGIDKFINKIMEKIQSRMEFDNTDDLLLELEQRKIDKYIESKNKEIVLKDILGYNAGVIFGDRYHSELGNRLCELHPELDFIVIINMSKAISYRAINDDVDLGKDIAKFYGGGGHPQSAGSPISDNIRNNVIDILFNNRTI